MKRAIVLLLFLVCVGCADQENEKPLEGYVVEKLDKDHKVLLIEDLEAGDVQGIIDDPSKVSDYRYSYWIKINNNSDYSKIKLGQRIAIWIKGGVDDSQPAKATALKVEILSE